MHGPPHAFPCASGWPLLLRLRHCHLQTAIEADNLGSIGKEEKPGCHGCCKLTELDTLKGHMELPLQSEWARHQDHPAVRTRCDDVGPHDCFFGTNYLVVGCQAEGA